MHYTVLHVAGTNVVVWYTIYVCLYFVCTLHGLCGSYALRSARLLRSWRSDIVAKCLLRAFAIGKIDQGTEEDTTTPTDHITTHTYLVHTC